MSNNILNIKVYEISEFLNEETPYAFMLRKHIGKILCSWTGINGCPQNIKSAWIFIGYIWKFIPLLETGIFIDVFVDVLLTNLTNLIIGVIVKDFASN